jgi:hypothetical protein
MELQQFCKNHPTKKAVDKCTQCLEPLCPECRILLKHGVFCSDACYKEFLEVRERIIDERGRRTHFSFVVLVKHLLIAALLIGFICGVLYWWLGTLNPAEMWEKLARDIRLMF